MTFFGNLVFTPILMAFLITSSLLLFTELAGIPNGFLVILLDTITLWWNFILSVGSGSWLITCAKPPTIILICIPIIVFVVLHMRSINTTAKRIITLSVLMLACLGICMVQQKYNTNSISTAQLNDNLYVIKLINSPSIIMIDKGFFSRKKSVDKAIEYEIKPWIVKMYGNIDIKELRITKPNIGSFKAAAYLAQHWTVSEIWLPFFKETLSKQAWRSFFDLKRLLDSKNIRLVRYNPLHHRLKRKNAL